MKFNYNELEKYSVSWAQDYHQTHHLTFNSLSPARHVETILESLSLASVNIDPIKLKTLGTDLDQSLLPSLAHLGESL